MVSCVQDPNLHMPDDVLIDILKQLPVRSLLRFKCVSKNWYNLIQNPNFACTHLHSQKLQNKAHLFVQYFDDDTSHYHYTLFSDETLASDAYHDLDSLESNRSVVVDGPVNGLFCLCNKDDRFAIWNPAIREFTTFFFPRYPPGLIFLTFKIGFGFDPSADDYKVVLIREFLTTSDTDEVGGGLVKHVYSLRTNTWRHLDGLDDLLPKYFSYCFERGAYSNGVYYWWAGSVVLAFDMGNDVFRVISVPFIQSEFVRCSVKPYNDDRIALYNCEDVPEGETDKWGGVWVMEEEGCWIKQFNFGHMTSVGYHQGFWKNNEFLFIERVEDGDEYQLVSYNPCTQVLRHLGPKMNCVKYQALVYHESLVSVNGGICRTKGKLSDSVVGQYFFSGECPRVSRRRLSRNAVSSFLSVLP